MWIWRSGFRVPWTEKITNVRVLERIVASSRKLHKTVKRRYVLRKETGECV